AYDLEKKLKSKGTYYQTYYQLDEGHVPRPAAMRDVIQYIHQWMNDVENKNLNIL
ncbi:MAG: S9 family peptidase, partial [Staphylococcus epidermidis]|nr:S9 family peptidase [Staphylococcus epidermidis]